MTPTEGFNVPRRTLDVEDYIDILRRHKGWIFGPFLLTLVGSVVGVYLWPDSYESQAAIRIKPQQVPQTMVASGINQEMVDRINSMAQQIRSRTVLTTIINSFGLYQRERAKYPIEDVIEQMNSKIDVIPLGVSAQGRTVPAFMVKFSYENRYLAQRVVQDLITRFMDQNSRDRADASFQTTQFMRDQRDAAKKELDDLENKLTDFRVANNGRLPDQVNANMQQLQAVQTNVTYLANAISRSEQEKLVFENNVRILKDEMVALAKDPVDQTQAIQQKNERLAEVDREIQQWETALSNLRKQYKDSFPDVQTAANRLQVAKDRRDAVLKEDAEKKKAEPAAPVKTQSVQVARQLRELDANVRRLEASVQGKDLELKDLNLQMKRANEQVKAYTSRIETVPLGEKQYGDLIRDREIARVKFTEYEEKLGRAQTSQDMEGRKQGETLELLDSPTLPINPTQPKRPMIISIGAGLGLLLGIVIAGAREMKDTSLKNLKDVRAYTQMAILGSVPLLENDFVVRRRRRLAWLGWTTASLVAVVTMAGSVVYYYVTRV